MGNILTVLFSGSSSLPSSPPQVLNDVDAGRYIHGVAVHWYTDSFVPAELSLGTTHHLYPEYYLFGTEACAGWRRTDRGVKLGSWERAEQYAHDIIQVRPSYHVDDCYIVVQPTFIVYFGMLGAVSERGVSPTCILQCRLTVLYCTTAHTHTHTLCNRLQATTQQAATGPSVSFFLILSQKKPDSIPFILHGDIHSPEILIIRRDFF